MSAVVKLQCLDGEVPVARELCDVSVTIKNLLSDVVSDDAIPVPGYEAGLVKEVFEWAAVNKPGASDKSQADREAFNKSFFESKQQKELFRLILCANFLDIKELLQQGCHRVAEMLRGKTPEQVKEMFGVTRDFTPEEVAEMEKEFPWAKEQPAGATAATAAASSGATTSS